MDARNSTLALIERYYAAFNEGDIATMLDCLTDDVIHDVNQSGRELGKLAFQRFLERMNHCYREQIDELVVFASDNGLRGAAEYVVQGSYLVTDQGLPEARGQTYRLPGGAFFDVREGKIARVTNYYNLELWMKLVT